MRIRMTEAAASAIRERIGAGSGRLKLVYDAEGCGCAVSGVPALWIVDAPNPEDAESAGDPISVLYEPRHELFFDREMKLEYDSSRRTFSLKSDQQIFHPRMTIQDMRI